MKLNENYIDACVFDDFGELNFDLEYESSLLAKKENIGITRDRELFKVVQDREGNAVAAAWISYDADNYEWDIVVDSDHQRKKIGSFLVDCCISEFSYYKEINPLCTMNIIVVSDKMKELLEKKGFKIERKISKEQYVMNQENLTKKFLKKYEKNETKNLTIKQK